MYILTDKSNIIIFISSEATMTSNGIDVGSNIILTDKTLGIIELNAVPTNVVPKRYCYSTDNGFYLNPSYTPSNGDIMDKVNDIINKIDPVIDEDSLTLDEMVKLQVSRVGAACSEFIEAGIDVALSDGVEHFSLTLKDQNNIDLLKGRVKEGLTMVPYHSDTNACKFYIATDILKIADEKDSFLLYQTTYCNAINTWIRRSSTKEEIRQIYFGSTLPDDLKDALNDIIVRVNAEIEALKQI